MFQTNSYNMDNSLMKSTSFHLTIFWDPKDYFPLRASVISGWLTDCKLYMYSLRRLGAQWIYNGNCTEWSAIRSEIKRVITRCVSTSLISDQNCTTWSAISTLLYSFWNLQAATPVCSQKTRLKLPHFVTWQHKKMAVTHNDIK